ncbi:hypothetical protein CTM50_03640 [Prevotella intermedia]|uniref:Uncharacterized protein n=1 Tax=Prevotella intermedia TaxID=28131 RepID=A0A2D3NA52_PREIN|nr:hypothetical protein CTM50_03640 [Prevotella intermedia]
MALRKRLFCRPKEPLLPCKTYAFTLQNNRFRNVLITSKLHKSYACEKYLHYSCLLSSYKISCFHRIYRSASIFQRKKMACKARLWHKYCTFVNRRHQYKSYII